MAAEDDGNNDGAPRPSADIEQRADVVETVHDTPKVTGLKTYRDGKLFPWEERWRDRFERLKAKGYLLRPRFRPGWEPSWVLNGTDRYLAEDFLSHKTFNAIDATCMKDNSFVMLKRIPAGETSSEFRIGTFFTTLDTPRDPRNHCVPILDSFKIEDDEALYITMPILREFDDPPFFSVSEVIDFIHQTLEGTKFMHDHLVAHRDLSTFNIMMDGTSLYPNGFHPGDHSRTVAGTDLVKDRFRLYSTPVFYYLIDFGLSTKYEGDGPYDANGSDGQDREAPELQRDAKWPYNPFPLDIFTLGNVYKKAFLDNYTNLEFLRPLVEKLTQLTPKDRPTISEAIAMFEPIYAARKRPSFRKRLHPPEEGRFQQNVLDIFASLQDTKYMTSYFFTYWCRALTFRRPWKT